MKKIPESYDGRGDQKGYKFTLVQRSLNMCIYSKLKHDKPTYEVMRIHKAKKPQYINGNKLKDVGDEYFPSSSQWGIAGWSYSKLEDACKKFNEIDEHIKRKSNEA